MNELSFQATIFRSLKQVPHNALSFFWGSQDDGVVHHSEVDATAEHHESKRFGLSRSKFGNFK